MKKPHNPKNPNDFRHREHWQPKEDDMEFRKRIEWRFTGSPGDPGRWVSKDGRFTIRPIYMATTRPQEYVLSDSLDNSEQHLHTVKLCKEIAETLM